MAATLPSPTPPHRIRVAVNVHHWDQIAFLHWPVESDIIRPFLPSCLGVDTYEGAAWISVTPFVIRVRPLGVPVVLPGWAFPETNLRTYVVGPDGTHGIWFLRMEVTAPWFAAALRTIGLPYFRHHMTVDRADDRVRYRSEAKGRGGLGAYDIVLRADRPFDPPFGGPREQFLTARWDAYHQVGSQVLTTSVQHPPWCLRTARIEHCDVAALFASAGLATPNERPVAHMSPGVTVRVGMPSRVRRN